MVGLYYGIYQHITDVDHPDRYFRSQWGGRPQSLGVKPMGGATGGCGGQCPPTFGTSGVQGVQEAVQWKWSLLLQQTVFIQYCTWLNFNSPDSSQAQAPLSTCQNRIEIKSKNEKYDIWQKVEWVEIYISSNVMVAWAVWDCNRELVSLLLTQQKGDKLLLQSQTAHATITLLEI